MHNIFRRSRQIYPDIQAEHSLKTHAKYVEVKSKKVSQIHTYVDFQQIYISTHLSSNVQDREFIRGQKDQRFKTSRCVPELLYNLKFEDVKTGWFDHVLPSFIFDNRTKQM